MNGWEAQAEQEKHEADNPGRTPRFTVAIALRAALPYSVAVPARTGRRPDAGPNTPNTLKVVARTCLCQCWR